MKTTKDGKLKLSKDERQIGNFVIKNESEYVKICDINSQMTHRVSKSLNIGKMLEMAFKERENQFLENYIALVWVFSNITPDPQFVTDIDRACTACVNRHKEFYGIEENITSEEDAEIIEEAKEVYDFLEEIKKEE